MAHHHNDESFESMCLGKQQHETKADASAGIPSMRAQYGGKFRAYKCLWGNHWHIGHVSRARAHAKNHARNWRRENAYV
jgi:hypothetical protein